MRQNIHNGTYITVWITTIIHNNKTEWKAFSIHVNDGILKHGSCAMPLPLTIVLPFFQFVFRSRYLRQRGTIFPQCSYVNLSNSTALWCSTNDALARRKLVRAHRIFGRRFTFYPIFPQSVHLPKYILHCLTYVTLSILPLWMHTDMPDRMCCSLTSLKPQTFRGSKQILM
jgi:hypothetical protein